MLNLCHGRTFEGHGVTFLHLYCRGTLISYLGISSAVFLLHGCCNSLRPSLVTYDVFYSLAMRCSHFSSHFCSSATPLFTLEYLTYVPPLLLHVSVRPLPQLLRPVLHRPRFAATFAAILCPRSTCLTTPFCRCFSRALASVCLDLRSSDHALQLHCSRPHFTEQCILMSSVTLPLACAATDLSCLS